MTDFKPVHHDALLAALVARAGGSIFISRDEIADLRVGDVLTRWEDGLTITLAIERGPEREFLPLNFSKGDNGLNLKAEEVTALGLLFVVRDIFGIDVARQIVVDATSGDASTFDSLRRLTDPDALPRVVAGCLAAIRSGE